MTKLATSPQKRSGWLSMTPGPGWMPWMISAPHHQRHDRVARDAQRQRRDEGRLGGGVVGGFGSDDSGHMPRAESVRTLGDPLLQSISHEGRDRRARARQDTEKRPGDAAPHHWPTGLTHVLGRRHQVAQPYPVGRSVTMRAGHQVGDDLRHAEQAHRHGDDAQPVGEVEDAEREPVGSRGHVGAHHSEGKADGDHRQAPYHAVLRKRGGGDQSEDHQREIVRGAKGQRDARRQRRDGEQEQDREHAADEGGDRGEENRGPGSTLSGHGIAVQADHRR